ncbi:hypothetical protein INR49_019875 [Caranx melampygus]|nr:hypothetical protein INR49_019875 [Caranx melampygus]
MAFSPPSLLPSSPSPLPLFPIPVGEREKKRRRETQQRGVMEASRKTRPFSPQWFSKTQTHTVWLLLVSVSIAAADTMSDKTQLPSRNRALKGRDEKMVVAETKDKRKLLALIRWPGSACNKVQTYAAQSKQLMGLLTRML